MPTAAIIEGHNVELRPSPGNPHVGGLAVRFEEMSGMQFMRSAWDFDSIEVLRMLNGGKLLLSVSAPRHPVVHLEVGPMAADFEPAFTVRRVLSNSGVKMVRVETLRVHDGVVRRLYCEEALDCGLGIAVGRAVDQIENLAREKGWGGE